MKVEMRGMRVWVTGRAVRNVLVEARETIFRVWEIGHLVWIAC